MLVETPLTAAGTAGLSGAQPSSSPPLQLRAGTLPARAMLWPAAGRPVRGLTASRSACKGPGVARAAFRSQRGCQAAAGSRPAPCAVSIAQGPSSGAALAGGTLVGRAAAACGDDQHDKVTGRGAGADALLKPGRPHNVARFKEILAAVEGAPWCYSIHRSRLGITKLPCVRCGRVWALLRVLCHQQSSQPSPAVLVLLKHVRSTEPRLVSWCGTP